MKRPSLLLLGGGALVIALSAWTSGGPAIVRPPVVPSLRVIDPGEYLLNRICVVTVDPFYTSKPVVAGKENIVTGFRAEDSVEGVLIRMDSKWLVLGEPYYENWIPTSKVIMIHARK